MPHFEFELYNNIVCQCIKHLMMDLFSQFELSFWQLGAHGCGVDPDLLGCTYQATNLTSTSAAASL